MRGVPKSVGRNPVQVVILRDPVALNLPRVAVPLDRMEVDPEVQARHHQTAYEPEHAKHLGKVGHDEPHRLPASDPLPRVASQVRDEHHHDRDGRKGDGEIKHEHHCRRDDVPEPLLAHADDKGRYSADGEQGEQREVEM